MDPSVIALLRQLTSSQQAVSQLQAVLSAMGNIAPDSGAVDGSFDSDASSASSPAVTLNRDGATATVGSQHQQSYVGTQSHASQQTKPTRSRVTRPSTQSSRGHQQIHDEGDGAWEGHYTRNSQRYHVTTAEATARTARAAATAAGSHSASRGRQAATTSRTATSGGVMPTVSLQTYEQLERLLRETDAERRTAQQRVSEMESEVQRLTQRVHQLSSLLQDQRRQEQQDADTHQLALDEIKHTYEAVLQRKDQVHEESLRQVLQSRKLLVAAQKFETTVRAREGGGGLIDGATPVNVRMNRMHEGTRVEVKTPSTRARAAEKWSEDAHDAPVYSGGSSRHRVKRERSAEGDSAGTYPAIAARSSNSGRRPFPQPASVGPRGGGSGAAGRGVTVSRGVGSDVVDDGTGESITATASVGAAVNMAGASISTSPRTRRARAQTTDSTTLAARNSAPSSRRRRTPRTPSLTNADRITSSRSPLPPLPTTASATGGGSATSPWLSTPTPTASAVRSGNAATTMVSPAVAGATRLGGQAAQHRFVAQYDQAGAASVTQGLGQQKPNTRGIPPPVPSRSDHHITATATNGRSAITPPAMGVVFPASSGASSVVGGPTRSPSPVNPKRGPKLPRRFIFTALTAEEQETLARAIEALGDDASVLASGPDEPPPFATTHIITRGSPRSVKALCGVVAGKWLVPPEYVLNSLQAGFWLDEYDEGTLRLFPPPLKGQRFLLSIGHAGIRAKLVQVVQYGGGEVVGESTSSPRTGDGSVDERSRQRWTEQGVVVLTSGDDLLRYATQPRV